VKAETNLPVMISPGVVPAQVLADLAYAGVDWYACYQETHNRQLFYRLRSKQNFDLRVEEKYLAKKLGLLVEEGILAGVGESLLGIPMSGWPSPPRIYEMMIIAVLRLMFPDRLIPASLDIDGLGGLQERLKAGANVVTSLIPPHLGLAGVAQASLNVNDGYRTVKGVVPLLEELGLSVATAEDYINWVKNEEANLRKKDICVEIKG